MTAILVVIINALAPFLVEVLKDFVDEWKADRERVQAIEEMRNVPRPSRDGVVDSMRDGSF